MQLFSRLSSGKKARMSTYTVRYLHPVFIQSKNSPTDSNRSGGDQKSIEEWNQLKDPSQLNFLWNKTSERQKQKFLYLFSSIRKWKQIGLNCFLFSLFFFSAKNGQLWNLIMFLFLKAQKKICDEAIWTFCARSLCTINFFILAWIEKRPKHPLFALMGHYVWSWTGLSDFLPFFSLGPRLVCCRPIPPYVERNLEKKLETR